MYLYCVHIIFHVVSYFNYFSCRIQFMFVFVSNPTLPNFCIFIFSCHNQSKQIVSLILDHKSFIHIRNSMQREVSTNNFFFHLNIWFNNKCILKITVKRRDLDDQSVDKMRKKNTKTMAKYSLCTREKWFEG